MDNVNLIIADNLKSIRVSRGWSQSFVANQLGIAQRTISRAECGCGISKRTLKMLSGLYQVPMEALYSDCVQERPKGMQIVPEDIAVGLLIKNSFIRDLEHEVVLRYTAKIQKEALMMREDIEQIIQETLVLKKEYTLADVVKACMVVNQKTLVFIRRTVSV